jgi:hypothetical protein
MFIPKLVADSGFLRAGVAYGYDDDCWWAVVDPRVHPLYVWKKHGRGMTAYSSSAQALNAAIFTNGPMMGKRLGPMRKLTRSSVSWAFAKWASAGMIGGLVAGRWLHLRYLCGIGGAAIGIAYAWRRSFTNWIPCGIVYSHDAGIDDRRNFDDEGKTHAWFGRFASDFSSYCIGDGDLPKGVREGLGGLVRLVKNSVPAGKNIDDAAFNCDFAQLCPGTIYRILALRGVKSNPQRV